MIIMKYLFIIVAALFLLPTTNYQLPTTLAQSPSCPIQSPNPRVDKGLITTLTLSGNFGTPTGACVVDAKAPFAPFKIPTYDDLKSIYFTQSKTNKTSYTPPAEEADQSNINSLLLSYDVIHITRNLRIRLGSTISGPAKPVVVFVDGYFAIDNNITYGNSNSGLVFVVKGDVNIFKDVTRVDAVIISSGTICTAFDGSACPSSNITTSQLIINGSLISLDLNKPIKFRRLLTDNSLPAEKIINQPKYLVILRNILSDTWQKWSEIQ